MKIAIPNHNKMDVYSHGEKLIHRDLNVKAPTNFSIVTKIKLVFFFYFLFILETIFLFKY